MSTVGRRGLLVGDIRRLVGLVTALVAGVLWAVLASSTPTNTYHFAPMVMAGAWAAVDGARGAGLTHRQALYQSIGGFGLAVGAAVILELKGDLDGPVFWDSSDDAPVLVEHGLFAGLGAVAGGFYAVRAAARPPSR